MRSLKDTGTKTGSNNNKPFNLLFINKMCTVYLCVYPSKSATRITVENKLYMIVIEKLMKLNR